MLLSVVVQVVIDCGAKRWLDLSNLKQKITVINLVIVEYVVASFKFTRTYQVDTGWVYEIPIMQKFNETYMVCCYIQRYRRVFLI